MNMRTINSLEKSNDMMRFEIQKYKPMWRGNEKEVKKDAGI